MKREKGSLIQKVFLKSRKRNIKETNVPKKSHNNPSSVHLVPCHSFPVGSWVGGFMNPIKLLHQSSATPYRGQYDLSYSSDMPSEVCSPEYLV